MVNPANKLPNLMLIFIAASSFIQRCEAFSCAKQKVSIQVDIKNSFDQTSGKIVIPYEHILKKCRAIHRETTHTSDETALLQDADRPSSLVRNCVSTPSSTPRTIITLLQAINHSQSPSTQITQEPINQHSEIVETSRQINVHDELKEVLPFLSEELIKIIEHYIHINWFDTNNYKAFALRHLSGLARTYKFYLICPMEDAVFVHNCKVGKEIPDGPQKRRLLRHSRKIHKKSCEELEQKKKIYALWSEDVDVTCTQELSNGRVAAGYTDGRIIIRTLTKPKADAIQEPPELTIKAYDSSVTALQLLPSNYLVSGSKADGPVRIWNTEGRLISEIPGLPISTLSITESGESKNSIQQASIVQLLTTNDKLIVIYDISNEAVAPLKQDGMQRIIIFSQLL